MLHRLAFRDFLLIAFSVTVIVSSQWPEGQDRQTIRYRDPSGHVQQYSLAADDPRLLVLADPLRQRKVRKFSDVVAIARWRYELAGYYAQHTGAQHAGTQRGGDDPSAVSGLVMPVSFEKSASSLVTEVTPDTAAYWTIARRRAEEELRWAEQQLTESAQAQAQARPAVELGEIAPSSPGLVPLLTAAVAGIIVAYGFVFWARTCPAIGLCDSRERSKFRSLDSEGALHRSPLELELPAEWVRVHQPLGVHVRRFGYIAIVSAAMVSVFF